jgi:hypothetical protein
MADNGKAFFVTEVKCVPMLGWQFMQGMVDPNLCKPDERSNLARFIQSFEKANSL